MQAGDVSECVACPGEILIARSNTPELVGRVAMFEGEPQGVVASDLTIRIWPSHALQPQFLTAYLSFLYLTGYWKERAGGASGSMKKITRRQIQDEFVPVPMPVDQQHVTAELGDQMASPKRTRTGIEDELETINRLPPALLRPSVGSYRVRFPCPYLAGEVEVNSGLLTWSKNTCDITHPRGTLPLPEGQHHE